jgi:hypothetical protein
MENNKRRKGKIPGGANQPRLAAQGPTPAGMQALAARALHASQAGPTCSMQPRLAAHACMQGQAGPTCRTRPQGGADARVKAVVSDHAPLRGGRGLLAPRGPRATGLQASGPSFVSRSTKFNS